MNIDLFINLTINFHQMDSIYMCYVLTIINFEGKFLNIDLKVINLINHSNLIHIQITIIMV